MDQAGWKPGADGIRAKDGLKLALLQKGATTLDRDGRIAAYHELQTVLHDDLPFLPTYQATQIEGIKVKLRGYAPNINVRLNTWNINTWNWA